MAASSTNRTAHKGSTGAEQSAGKRKAGRPKGTKASEAQKAAGKRNLKKSSTARAARKEARAAEEVKPRWKQLEDGDLRMRDLEDEELIRGECANNDGSWEGKRHQLAPRLQQQMATEWKRRYRNKLDKLGPLALEAIEDILNDDANRAQQWAAARMITEYQVGKVPDVVHVGVETEYDKLSQSAFVILRGRDNVAVDEVDMPALNAGGEDIVDGEIIEEETA